MSVVLITGCSSGMGEAAALAFARAGDTVIASMRDTGKGIGLRAAADATGLDIRIVALDVRRPDSFARTIESIVADCGRLDVLVNNAGVLRAGALEDLGERGLREVMETNFFGPLLLTRAVLPQMRRQRSGCIIMISSLSGLAGLPGDVPYTASKFAVEGATEALRHEVDRWNIRLALVEPALYATRIFDSSLPATGPLPAEYARGLAVPTPDRAPASRAAVPAAAGVRPARSRRTAGHDLPLRRPAAALARGRHGTQGAGDDVRAG